MYLGISNRRAVRGPGLAGLFGCDLDPAEFAAENKVVIYPGKVNVWLLVRRKGQGTNVEEIINKYIKGPLNTATFGNNVLVGDVKKLPNDPQTIQINMSSWGRRTQETTLGKLTYPVDVGTDLEFYMLSFAPPKDAPTRTPWPLEGCAEKANWALSAALSDIRISTGLPTDPTNTSSTNQPVTAEDVERHRIESLEALTAINDLDSGSSPQVSWLWVIGLVGVAGVVFFAPRQPARTR